MNARRFGATLTDDGVTFSLWAPAARRVDVVLDQTYAMKRMDDGWFVLDVPSLHSGALYRFRIDESLSVPDPASHFQPDDIGGPSMVIDHRAYRWRATEWRGRPWNETVAIETHVGTFTQDGTYRAMIGKLDHLADCGFTALELMPLADFPGRRNWGYDGVLWYAPDSSYGTADDLKSLIDEAHLRGMMVFLDAVYNHFGPEGNYLGHYAPAFFSPSQTPWGNAIDYRVPQVRQFVIQNVRYWLETYRFDGLRLDAVHAIAEGGEPSILTDISNAAGDVAARTGRHIHVVLENDDNSARLLDPLSDPPGGQFRAQWNDDYHHAWHVLLTDEQHGYYSDYQTPREDLVRCLGSGFSYQGQNSPRRNAPRGEASKTLPPLAFVNFLQNHDQIGNRVLGDRLEASADPAPVEAALAITLLAPMIPMMFMGEEWGAKTPFPFFCDFKGELADAIRQGRRREFRSAYEKYGDDVPDPLDEATFQSAKLNWDELARRRGRTRITTVRDLLAVRRANITPHLSTCKFDQAAFGNGLLTAQWRLTDPRLLRLAANLSAEPISLTADHVMKNTIWGDANNTMPPWSVIWGIGDA